MPFVDILYLFPMYKVAITGAVASGKSTLLYHLKKRGFPVFDCDVYIRELYKNPKILEHIQSIMPQVFVNGAISKNLIVSVIRTDLSVLKKLQNILYPYLYKQIQKFCTTHRTRGGRIIFIEVPLVFENGTLSKYDAVIIVRSPIYKRRYNFFRRGAYYDLWQIANKTQWSEDKKLGYKTGIKKLEFFLHSKKMLNKEANCLLAKIKCIAT